MTIVYHYEQLPQYKFTIVVDGEIDLEKFAKENNVVIDETK